MNRSIFSAAHGRICEAKPTAGIKVGGEALHSSKMLSLIVKFLFVHTIPDLRDDGFSKRVLLFNISHMNYLHLGPELGAKLSPT